MPSQSCCWRSPLDSSVAASLVFGLLGVWAWIAISPGLTIRAVFETATRYTGSRVVGKGCALKCALVEPRIMDHARDSPVTNRQRIVRAADRGGILRQFLAAGAVRDYRALGFRHHQA